MKKYKRGERVITVNGQGKVIHDQMDTRVMVRLTATGETDKYDEDKIKGDSVTDKNNLSVSIREMHGLSVNKPPQNKKSKS